MSAPWPSAAASHDKVDCLGIQQKSYLDADMEIGKAGIVRRVVRRKIIGVVKLLHAGVIYGMPKRLDNLLQRGEDDSVLRSLGELVDKCNLHLA